MVPGSRGSARVTAQERHAVNLRTHTDKGLALGKSDLTPLKDEVDPAPPKNEHDQLLSEGRQVKSRNTSRARKRTTSQVEENIVTDSEALPKKRKRARKVEPVYIIPDVEKKATTYQGRLGMNVVLHFFARITSLYRLCLFKHGSAERQVHE